MKRDMLGILGYLRSEGFEVMNWMPGSRRVYKVLDNRDGRESKGMYSNELRAWYNGYCKAKGRV